MQGMVRVAWFGFAGFGLLMGWLMIAAALVSR
jgi:hypothetical protein